MAARTIDRPSPDKHVNQKRLDQKRLDHEPKPQYAEFAAALRRHRQGSGFPTQARLAAALDKSWHAVGSWERGMWRPPPEEVFRIERLLALPAGSLSRLLGYLPVNVQPEPSVLAAIDSEPRLDAKAKDLLTELYRSLVRKRPGSLSSSTARRRPAYGPEVVGGNNEPVRRPTRASAISKREQK